MGDNSKHSELTIINSDMLCDIENQGFCLFNDNDGCFSFMSSVTSEIDMPYMLKKQKLSIVPISNSKYAIGHFDVFTKISNNDSDSVVYIKPNSEYDTLNFNEITSESDLILFCFVNEIIDDCCNFNENKESGHLTKSGKYVFSNYDMILPEIIGYNPMNIESIDLEVGFIYEYPDKIVIVRGTIGEKDNFYNIYIYYTYCLLKQLSEKKIYVEYLNYSGGSILVNTYKYMDINNYKSLK